MEEYWSVKFTIHSASNLRYCPVNVKDPCLYKDPEFSSHLLYPQTKVGDILDSGPSRRRRRRRRRRNFLVDAITQKQINIFFSNLVHMLRVPKGRSLF